MTRKQQRPATASGMAPQVRWDAHDLHMHQRSRQAHDVYLGQHPTADAEPAVRPPIDDNPILLPRQLELPDYGLVDVMRARRSLRSYSRKAIPLDALSGLLDLAARNTSGPYQARDGTGELVARNYPSGGASYPLEIYLAVAHNGLRDVDPGLYHYCPQRHALEPVVLDSTAVRPFFQAAKSGALLDRLPPVVLLFSARFDRVASRYRNIAYRLVLVELGCLMQSLYLAATLLDLGVCALGGGCDDEAFARLVGVDPQREPLVGEMVLGLRRTAA